MAINRSLSLRAAVLGAVTFVLVGCDQKGPTAVKQPTQAPATSRRTDAAPSRTAMPGVEGTQAADFALTDGDGETVRLSDYKGKVVLVDFWATWCPPCRKEIPGFVQLKDKYGSEGVEIIGVAVSDEWPNVEQFSKAYKINYPVVMGDQETVRSYGNFTGIPTTFVIDREGVIRKKHTGYASPEFFAKAIEDLL